MQSVLYYYTLTVVCMLIFLYNFCALTSKEYMKNAELPTHIDDLHLHPNETYKPQIDRLVFVVIDALRLDFVNADQMPFLAHAATTNGCLTKVKVETPTVTMPRLKSLTTGSVSQFVDVVLNFGVGTHVSDSLLHQAARAGKKIIFYGDNTWLELYPDLFLRHEGVSSFFVNDYTEVDDNVTRNLHVELNNSDWDIMILHYLGLDHIGHVYGPFSPLVGPKLADMDALIKTIVGRSETWPQRTSVVVTGDHGMRDSGGHGGSTMEEVHVPFVSIGRECRDGSAFQTDIPTTLALLMGLNIPGGSIGRVLSHLFSKHNLTELLYLHYYSTQYLKTRLHCGDVFAEAKQAHHEFLKTHDHAKGYLAQNLYEECSLRIAETLIRSSVRQDLFKLLTSSSTIALILVYSFCMLLLDYRANMVEMAATTILIALQICLPFGVFATTVYGLVLLLLAVFPLKILLSHKFQLSLFYKFVFFNVFLHAFSFFSSSFVEEEHQTWYFFWQTFTAIAMYVSYKHAPMRMFDCFTLSMLMRFARTINQTGDKWASLPDLSDWLLLSENSYYLYAFLAIGLLLIWMMFIFHTNNYFYGIILLAIFAFRTTGHNNFVLGQIVWLLILIQFGINLKCDRFIDNLIITSILTSALLLRPYNVILLPICIYSSFIICKHFKDVTVRTILHIVLSKVLYFCQGHSNSLSSIDVACGYVGLPHYIPVLIFFQILLHTYTFPILSNLLLVRESLANASVVWTINMVHQTLVLLSTVVTTQLHKYHLFVWTVFAPKLLFEVSHSLVLFVEVSLYYVAVFVKNRRELV